jgi:carboxyvinyl-carboxyphosphonate phosphorylmutase
MTKSKAAVLRSMLKENKLIMAPGAYDGITARLVEEAGFPAIYVTGAGVASTRLGMPDIGLITMSEMVDAAKNIAACTTIPVICDIDTGYGNALNLMRSVREFKNTGVAAIQIEDQITPKRCGHTGGKQVVSKEEMVNKIKAAVLERGDSDLVLIARTDAIQVNGFEDALDRAKAYAEAGADVLFVEAPKTEEQMKRVTVELKHVPLLINLVERGGDTPCLPAKQLEAMGFKIAIYPVTAWVSAIKAIRKNLKVLKEQGATDSCAADMASFQEMFDLVDRPKYVALEKTYV